MDTAIVASVFILIIIGVLYSPPAPPRGIVVTDLDYSGEGLRLQRPKRFQPHIEEGYLVIEEPEMGILIYGKDERELTRRLHEEIALLWQDLETRPEYDTSAVKSLYTSLVSR